jgi:hypothetical protein
MAGLVPAIHVLQYFSMAGGYVYILTNRHWPRAWKVRTIVAANPDWDDLYPTITQ